MRIVPDRSSESNDDDPAAPRDPLIDRLRREATAERPRFSPALHNRILQHVNDAPFIAKRSQSFWRRHWWSTAAAVVLLAGGLIVTWIEHSHTSPAANQPIPFVDVAPSLPPAPQQPVLASLPSPASLSVNVAGILSARLYPPQITVTLPISTASFAPEQAEAPPSAPSPALPSPPETMIERLQQPMTSAQAALADVVPPNLRALVDYVRLLRESRDESRF